MATSAQQSTLPGDSLISDMYRIMQPSIMDNFRLLDTLQNVSFNNQ